MSGATTIDSEHLAEIVVQETTIINFCITAALSLCYFDYALTFSDECRRIWGRHFSGATFLFVLNRYLTIIGQSLVFINFVKFQSFSSDNRNNICNRIIKMSQVIELICQLDIAIIISLRLYAIWSKNIGILVSVAFLGLLPQIARIYVYTQIREFKPLGPPFVGCGGNNIAAGGNILNSLLILWVIIPTYGIFYDAVVLALTWMKTAGIRRTLRDHQVNGSRSIATYLIRDGTVYFLCLMVLNAATLVGIKTWTIGGIPVLTEIITSVLTSRFMLNLRGVYLSDDDRPNSSHPSKVSDLQFASTIVGNLGAPLAQIYDSNFEENNCYGHDMEHVEHESSEPLSVGLGFLPSPAAIIVD